MTRLTLSRRNALLLPFLAAACGGPDGDTTPVVFAPLRYDHLTPIPLNVGSISIEQRFVPGASRNDLSRADPVDPSATLRQMAQDRLQALGASGRAVFIIQDASLVRSQGSYVGSFAVELDIYTSDNTRAGFAEARVSRTRTIDDDPPGPTLYEMTRALMDSMNVEFEFQVRRSLRDWLVTSQPAVPTPVERQPLSPPPV